MIERIVYGFLPYALASSGALASELAGSLAVFTDGFMQLGGFVFWVTATGSHSLLLGGLTAMAVAGFLAWLLGRWTRASGSNPFITALAVNAAASALTDSLSGLLYGKRGELLPPADSLLFAASKEGGLWADIGRLASSPLVWLSIASLAGLAVFLSYSRRGLWLRAAGRSPRALEERGIAVAPLRDLAWVLAGAGAALAGAILVWRLAAFTPSVASGRGWIALAIVFMGQRRLVGMIAASLVFSLAELLAVESRLFAALPPALLQAAPSLLALVLYALQSYSLKDRTTGSHKAGERRPKRIFGRRVSGRP